MKQFSFFSILIILDVACHNNSTDNNKPLLDSVSIAAKHLIDSTKTDTSLFCLVTNFNDTLTLFGKFELNKNVTLIDNSAGRVYETKTLSYHAVLESDWEPYVETLIGTQPNKKNNIVFGFFGNKPKDYHVIPKNNLDNPVQIHKMDSLITNSENYDKLLKDVGWETNDSRLNKATIELMEFNVEGKKIFIVTYKLSDCIGPRFAVINNTVFPLTGPNSLEHINAFVMNKTFYIETGSGGCNSGEVGYQIFELTEKGIENIYENWELSD